MPLGAGRRGSSLPPTCGAPLLLPKQDHGDGLDLPIAAVRWLWRASVQAQTKLV